jgi:CubicO group peptidase (beta-lactamase class C family)
MAKQRRGDARCWRVLGLGLLVAAGVSGPSAPGDATTPTSASASPLQIRDPEVLTAFVDSFIGAAMQREHIPGAAFVFVQDGRVVTMRGYGLADVARKRRVDPQTTIWRIGSISKVFTTIAVLQLVDHGRVALDAPAARYVHRVAVPAAGDSATVRQLLDHTAGFDEIRPGTQAATRDSVLPLDRFLTGPSRARARAGPDDRVLDVRDDARGRARRRASGDAVRVVSRASHLATARHAPHLHHGAAST